MPAKKKARRTVKKTKRKTTRKTSRSSRRSVNHSKSKVRIYNSAATIDRKKKIVLTNLGLFVILWVASYGLYKVSNTLLWENFFWIVSIITGFAAVAFLIVWLILFFLKVLKK